MTIESVADFDAVPPPSFPTWSCATAAGPGVRTGSSSRRTQG
jgi:hypothetical protein